MFISISDRVLQLVGNNLPVTDRVVDEQIIPLLDVLSHLGHDPRNAPFVAINLSWNKVKDIGANAFARFLLDSPCLSSLDLSGNDIGPVGGGKIAEAISMQTSLVHLNLNGNPLGNPQHNYNDPNNKTLNT